MTSKILNITNGDSSVSILQAAGIPGNFLPWRDVLHEGPVPQGLNLKALSAVRAQFIAERGWGDFDEINRNFIERDEQLEQFSDYEKVILWFEHDLYDQLQILQILDWFSQQESISTPLSMICTDQYLGLCSPQEMTQLLKFEQPITQEQLHLSHQAWASFQHPTPEKWYQLLNTDTSALKFLEGAIVRMLEEYPNCSNGLSRTAQCALQLVSESEQTAEKLFRLYQQTEERKFLGDSSFWVVLEELLVAQQPLLKLPEGMQLALPTQPDHVLTITEQGRAVLKGDQHWLEIHEIDQWIGGVHLTSADPWCWDLNAQSLCNRG